MNELGTFRVVFARIWNDGKFAPLSDRGKLAFFLVLTNPSLTSLGAMRATVPGLAAEIGWTPAVFRAAFRELLAAGLVHYDERASFVALPNYLRYNRPTSPNSARAWLGAWAMVPECPHKEDLAARMVECVRGMSDAFGRAFRTALGMAHPNVFGCLLDGAPGAKPDGKGAGIRDAIPDAIRDGIAGAKPDGSPSVPVPVPVPGFKTPPYPPLAGGDAGGGSEREHLEPASAGVKGKGKAKATDPEDLAGPVPDEELPHGPAFVAVWRDYEQHRARKAAAKQADPLTKLGVKRQLKRLGAMPEDRAVAVVDAAIERGWTGFVYDHPDVARILAEKARPPQPTPAPARHVDAPGGVLPGYCLTAHGPDKTLHGDVPGEQ